MTSGEKKSTICAYETKTDSCQVSYHIVTLFDAKETLQEAILETLTIHFILFGVIL